MRLLLQKVMQRALSSIWTRQRSYHASVLPSSLVSTSLPEFAAKAASMDELVKDMEQKMAEARLGGGSRAVERMRSKGKKIPRERQVPVIPKFTTCWTMST